MKQEVAEEQQISPVKKAYRRKGSIYILIFVVCLAASLIMNSAGIDGGIIYALLNFGFIVFLILAIVALVRGYSKK